MAQYNFQMNEYNGTSYDQLYPVGCVPYVTVTLPVTGWSGGKTQTVTVQGVLADETQQVITPTPALASQSAYNSAGVICTGQGANSLTFTANITPSTNITLYVTIQNAVNATLL